MPLIPWRPFWDLERFLQEIGDIEEWGISPFAKVRTPRTNVYETEDKVIAEIEMPGVNPNNIDIEVEENFLRVEGRGREEKEEKERGYYRREIGERYFKRLIPLPSPVIKDKGEAEYEDGLLKIYLPKLKTEKGKEKKIKIKVKKKKE